MRRPAGTRHLDLDGDTAQLTLDGEAVSATPDGVAPTWAREVALALSRLVPAVRRTTTAVRAVPAERRYRARYRAVVGFTRAELESYRDATLPDLVGPGPGCCSSGSTRGSGRPRRRPISPPGQPVLPGACAAGIINRPIDASAGYDRRRSGVPDRSRLGHHPSGGARDGAGRRAEPGDCSPEARGWRHGGRASAPVVAVLGITAYRRAFAAPGRAPVDSPIRWRRPVVGRAEPAGLNAHAEPRRAGDGHIARSPSRLGSR